MMAAVPHTIIDDFLPAEVHRGLLAHALQVRDFAPGTVLSGGSEGEYAESRCGLHSDDRLGPHLPPFRAALRQAFTDMCQDLGMPKFKLAGLEILLVAHGDGDYFKPHRDTFVGSDRRLSTLDRMITAVYYFHRHPRGFGGGELKLFPFGQGEPVVVDPRDNRLVAFPSFVLHEVLPVTVPGGDFADSRFSVSCWLDRDRPAPKRDTATASVANAV